MKRVQLSTANLLSFDEDAAESNRRRRGRFRCERLRCAGGKVIDVSQTGARLRLAGFPGPRIGQRRCLVFQTEMGPSREFSVVVRWVRMVGILRYEVGVEFFGLDAARIAQLNEIVRVHAGRTAIGGVDRAA